LESEGGGLRLRTDSTSAADEGRLLEDADFAFVALEGFGGGDDTLAFTRAEDFDNFEECLA
jgi:hypothetical protein